MRKSFAVVLGVLLAGGTLSAQYLITRVAGGGVPATPAVATSTALQPGWMATDVDGNVYFTSTNCVFKLDGSGVLTRVAGSSAIPGYSGDGGLATNAQLDNSLGGLAVDAAGNLYIADSGNSRVRRVAAATGIITTVAGNGTLGYSGDGGPATSAELDVPSGLAVDAAGNLYITDGTPSYYITDGSPGYPADPGNDVIRKVAAATGIITTVAGTGTLGYSGDGGPAASAQLSGPEGLAVDASGNLYIADSGNNRVRKVAAATGIITTVAGDGTVYPPADGVPATSTGTYAPRGVAVDGSGNLYISAFLWGFDLSMPEIRKVDANGIITTSMNAGGRLALDGAGNLYFSENGDVFKVTAVNTSTIVAGNGGSQSSGDGGPARSAVLDQSPAKGVAVDGSGNVYIADNTRVRKVTAATGIITTVAGNGAQSNWGDAGDGGPALDALLFAEAVAVDRSGNLYIGGGSVVRKVTAATGVISAFAGIPLNNFVWSGDGGPATSALFRHVTGLVVDGSGNVYIADGDADVVRKVTAATGIITRVAGVGGGYYSGDGGPATSAGLSGPNGLALDAAGNLYLTDYNRIRKVDAATGIITTVAGNGTGGYSGDGGPATSAQLFDPVEVATDSAGNLYITDSLNNVIRKVVAATGIITTVASIPNSPVNRVPATNQLPTGPPGLAVDTSGNVYFSDLYAVWMLVPVATRPVLTVTSTHSGNFARLGQIDASYTLVVSNNANAGPTSGTVTVTETLPAGLTLASISGPGWSCWLSTCSRDDVLKPGASFPALFVAVNVEADAPSQVTNQVVVSGGGSVASGTSDLTTISGPPPAPVPLSPANGAAGVLVAPTLLWVGAAESFDIYFGTSPTPPLAISITGTTYAPGILNPGTTYYWQIVARNSFGSTSSATWSFTTGATPIGSRFVPVTPCRVADTRNPGGPFGGPTMAAGSARSFEIPQSACGIPATAQAYAVNVTAVPAGPLSYLTLWPTGLVQPLVSTLNAFAGNVVANAAIVPAGTGGAVSVFVSNQTDVVLDINGYFDSTGAVNSFSFYPATPCRVADTRNATGQFGGPSMFTGQTRDFPIPLGPCAIPSGPTAYSLNVTVVPDTDYLAYLTTWPTGSPQPLVSTLNSWTGKIVANAALVPAGSNGSISVYVTDPTDVVLDVNGYFGLPGGAGALLFYPVAPCRVADTRNLAGAFGGPQMEAGTTRSFVLPLSGCPVPSNAAAYSVNVTAVPEGPLGFLTAWPTGSPQPFVSTLNSLDGEVVANAAIVPAGTNGAISIYVTNNTHLILDINGYFAP